MLEDAWISTETGKPFQHCVHCRFPLLETEVPWLVNKHYRRGECIIEYAICQTCRDEIAAGFSDESKAAIREFLETHIDWPKRLADFMRLDDPRQRLDACVKCELPRGEATEFAISGVFDEGGILMEGALPLMLCGGCTREMANALSPASRAAWQDFIVQHFAGPASDASGFPGMT
ncbi:MAG: hypothetical protein V4733_09625 [Verrucomicrobiota bacterium]